MSSTFDLETARKVARLARLAIPEADLPRYAGQLDNILHFVEQLREINTENIQPLANVTEISLKLREDIVTDGGLQAEVTANAPETVEGFFAVQKVVE